MARSKRRPRGTAGRGASRSPLPNGASREFGRPVRSGSRSRADHEEAKRRRLQREEEEARRRRRRRGLTALAVVAAVVLFAVLEVFLHRLKGQERTLLAAAPAAATSTGCGGVATTKPYPRGLDRFHIGQAPLRTMPPLSTYPSAPPASGPHAPTPLDAGVYSQPPPIGEAIHSLEHAAVIVWYDPSAASSPELDRLRRFFAQGSEMNHVIVAPYDYSGQGTAGKLPAGRQMALVAWHRVRYCDRPSLAVAFDFVHRFRYDLYQRGAYQGEAPEKYAPI